MQSVFEKENKIDFVANTAKHVLHGMPYDATLRSVAVNYTGAIIVGEEGFHYLKQSKGSILLYASSSYTRGRSLYCLYSSFKAAIVNLVQALSEEWECVKINCINPERTKTPMRIKNFGQEPEGSLLSSEKVAIASINTLFTNFSGQVVEVR